MGDMVRLQVLTLREEVHWFDGYCREKGYNKSPLIARLVHEYLDREAYNLQPDLFGRDQWETRET